MTSNGVSSQMNDLHLSDSDTEDLFASPSRLDQKKAHTSKPSLSETPKPPASASRANATPGQSRYDTEEAREAALRKELAGIRNINQVVEGVVESLEKAKGNMDVRACSPHTINHLSEYWPLKPTSSPFLAPCPTHAPSCKHGAVSYHRPNITNA